MDFTEAYDDTCSSVGLCCRSGNLEVLRKLLQSGKTVNVKDNRGWRPIHEAAANDNLSCLRLLLEQESTDVNWTTYEGETALLLAARKGLHLVVETLLQAGAEVMLTSNELDSPLIAAAGFGSLQCVKLLLEKGALIREMDCNGYTPLHAAADNNYVDVVSYLLKHGSSVTQPAVDCLTAAFLAAKSGFLECLTVMLNHAKEQGVNLVDLPSEDSTTPLMIAAQHGHLDCVQLLVAHGGSVNHKANDGVMALHLAVSSKNLECVKFLLPKTDRKALLASSLDLIELNDSKPDYNSDDFFNNSSGGDSDASDCSIKKKSVSPLHLAVEKKSYDILRYLLDEGLDSDAFLQRSLYIHSDCIVTDRGFELIAQYWPSYVTALGDAAQLGDEQSVAILLEGGRRPDAPPGNRVVNPLTVAAMLGHQKVLKLLLDAGADPNHGAPPCGCTGNWSRVFPLLAAKLTKELDGLWNLMVAGADVRRIMTQRGSRSARIWKRILRLCCRFVRVGDCSVTEMLQCMSHFTADAQRSFEILQVGYTLNEEYDDDDEDKCTGPSKLSHLCRIAIRECIIDRSTAIHYQKKIQSLPLPPKLLKILSFEEN